MKVLVPGHVYRLTNTGETASKHQSILFVQREESAGDMICDGISTEELVAVLIDRLRYLKLTMPGKSHEMAFDYASELNYWLEGRDDNQRF